MVNNLSLGNDEIRFDARFKGVSQHLCVPVKGVKAIYAKETGKGMGFDPEDDDGDVDAGKGGKGSGSHLRIIK